MTAGTAETATGRRPVCREVRLGLVLNGGVSLAIWIGGVIREIDNLRRASDEETFPEVEGTAAMYRSLLRILQQNVIVDVIAGASAGGINGIVLGGAIFAGKPLPNLRETWIGLGDFRTLLRSPSEPNPPSLMRGDEVVLSELRAVLGAVMDGADGQDCRQSHLYLYVTSTDLYGFLRTYHDSTGRPFDELDHRRTFSFRHLADTKAAEALTIRPEQLNVMRQPVFFYDPDAGALLARAARSTSSFPVAFEPHRLRVLGRARPPRNPDEEPGAQPQCDDRPVELRADWRSLIDGGVLDNQPFNPVLDRIAVLPPPETEVPTRRVVAYVVPYVNEPGSISAEAPEEAVALASYSASGSLPRTLSKLQSLDRVTAEWAEQQVARDDVRRLWLLLRNDDLANAAESLFDAYVRTRADAARRLFEQWADPLFQDGDGVLAQDPTIDPRFLTMPPVPAETDAQPRSEPWLPASLRWSQSDTTWAWGLAPAERAAGWALLSVRDLQESEQPRPSDPAFDEARAAVVRLAGDLIWYVRDEKQVLLEAFRASPGVDPLERARDAFNTVAGFLEVLQGHFVALDQAFETLNAMVPASRSLPDVSDLLHLEVVRNAFTIGDPRVPFPFDFIFMSAGCENSLGHTASTPDQKLAGMKLAHFAGFLKRSWRANDWLWGRLDGIEHSLRAILDLDLLPRFDLAEVGPELARLAFDLGDRVEDSPPEPLREAWQIGLQRAASCGKPLLALGEQSGDPRSEFLTLLAKAADSDRPQSDRERFLGQCRLAIAARIQTIVLQEDLDRVAETAVDDAESGASKLVNGYYWANRFFRRDQSLRRDGVRDLDITERVGLFKALEIGEENPKDEASSRLALGLAAQGAAVATAMVAGSRGGLPTSVRAILATVRGITLAASSVVRLLAQSPAVGAATVFALAALVVFSIVNPGVLLGSLTPALAIAVLVGGVAVLAIATSSLEQPIRSVGRAIGYTALIGIPLAFALILGWPEIGDPPDWFHEHVGMSATRVSAGLAAAAFVAALVCAALNARTFRPNEGPRYPLSWIRKALNTYRILIVLSLGSLSIGFVVTRWHHDRDSPAGCPTQCQGFNWDQAADEHAGTILVIVLTLIFLFAAAWIELLVPRLQARRETKHAGTPR